MAANNVRIAPISWLAASGSGPASSEIWASAMKRIPNPAPATAPSMSAPRVRAGRPGVVSRDTNQIPGRAASTPTHASPLGRSPRATPASTGRAAAPTAEIGATRPIRPRASPRNKKMLPVAEPTPARSAQAKSGAAGLPGTHQAGPEHDERTGGLRDEHDLP